MSIDHFRDGNRSARDKLNQLVDEANSLAALRGDEQFIAVRKGPGGTTIALNLANVLARIPKTPLGIFPVTVKKDGGSAGSKSTLCSFTYTVMDLLGNVMNKDATGADATGMTPEFNLRGTVGKMVAAADNSHGLAFYAGTGGTTLVLWMTTEQPATGTGTCP